ncbi:hypothetical protein D3C75_825100 [compost metagenome]
MHASVGHGRHVGLAQAHGAGGAQAFDGEGVALGHQVLEGRAAGGSGQAFDQVAVLGGVGDAVQRAQDLAFGTTGVGGCGLLQRFGVAHHHGVQGSGGVGAIVGIDARQVGLDQLDRRRAARLERVAQLGNGNLGYLDHAFTKKMCRWGLMRGVYKKGLAGAGLRGGKWFFAGGHCRAS